MKNILWLILSLLISSCLFTREKENKHQLSVKAEQVVEAGSIEETKQKENEREFTKLKVFNSNVEIEVFKELDPMPQSLFELKYPFEHFHTTQTYSNADGTITLLMSIRPETVSYEDLRNYPRTIATSFANNPSIELKQNRIRKINNRDFIVVEMITSAVDAQIYNLIYITSLEGKLLVCTFNCTLDKLSKWKPIGEKMLDSISLMNL